MQASKQRSKVLLECNQHNSASFDTAVDVGLSVPLDSCCSQLHTPCIFASVMKAAVQCSLPLQFKRIEEIEGLPASSMLDVLGIMESVGEFVTLTLKNATEQTKRSLVLKDNSNRSIELTLWGTYASNPGDQLAQVNEMFPCKQCDFAAQQYIAYCCIRDLGFTSLFTLRCSF